MMFDKAIRKVNQALRPHERACAATSEKFEVGARDIDFYQRFKIPPPHWSPIARRARRMAVTNFNRFHRRKCDATGKEIISQYSQTNPHKIFDNDYWWSDKWDAIDYGRSYDLTRPFFDQLRELRLAVPRAALNRDSSNVNSDYVIGGTSMKNCYFVFGGRSGENCLYIDVIIDSKNCIDSAFVRVSEYCYENVMPLRNARCFFSTESMNCLESYFLFDCRSCTSCFLCTNLRNKKYCFDNEQLSKADYEARMRSIDLGDWRVLEDYKQKFQELRRKNLVRATNNVNVDDGVGDDLVDCSRCFDAFQFKQSENIMHSAAGAEAKDVIDGWGISQSERIADSIRIYGSFDVKFGSHLRNCLDVEYSDDCYNCEHIFACQGLRYKKYCIFNKQYSKSEYEDLVDRIKTKMLEAGEYGEFPPMSMSPVPYQDSYAYYAREQQGLFPLEEAMRLGAWTEPEEPPQTKPDMRADELPDHIKDASDDLVGKIVVSSGDKRPYRIIKQELAFYRQWNLPIPRENYYERAARRARDLRAWRGYTRACSLCGKMTYTGLRPDYPGRLACDSCYENQVG